MRTALLQVRHDRLRVRDQASKREEPWKAARLNSGNSSRTRRIGSWAPLPRQGALAPRSTRYFRLASRAKTLTSCTAKTTCIASIPRATQHGFFAQFQRTVLRTATPVEEHKHLMHHLEDVPAGRFVVMVLAKERSRRDVTADILNAHGAEFIGFYGRWAWQGFTPPPEVSEAAGAHPVAGHALAGPPDTVPSLFVEAWNRRDPGALASLFDEDAEFVNVTGLWWHDRASIRTAHA